MKTAVASLQDLNWRGLFEPVTSVLREALGPRRFYDGAFVPNQIENWSRRLGAVRLLEWRDIKRKLFKLSAERREDVSDLTQPHGVCLKPGASDAVIPLATVSSTAPLDQTSGVRRDKGSPWEERARYVCLIASTQWDFFSLRNKRHSRQTTLGIFRSKKKLHVSCRVWVCVAL